MYFTISSSRILSFGRRKLKILLGALRGQIINILFTDEETAIEIIKAG